MFVESFAQLVTHKVCEELGDIYLDIFENLKLNQSDVYTNYHKGSNTLPNKRYSAYSKIAILNTFLINLDNEYLQNKLEVGSIEILRRSDDIKKLGVNDISFDFFDLLDSDNDYFIDKKFIEK